MKIFLFILLISSLISAQVKTGIEVLKELNFTPLIGKRVGLISNTTGVDSDLNSTVDILFEAPNVELTALFAPEHGIRGEHLAGEHVANYIDKQTGVIVYSLYGSSRKPTPQMLKSVDVLVYDIQDIGSRSYTYISTMGLAMEAAAENNKKFIVLDRPNPLGGNLIEGNIVEDGYYSFVSQFPIPYLYGLTAGELALFINEKILSPKGNECDLEIIKMKGWNRDMNFMETGLPWVPTSPHIPHPETAYYYAMTGIVGELNSISIGVGYTIPFETFAAPWIDANLLARKLNEQKLPGIIFRPITYKPFYGNFKDEKVNGVHILIKDFKTVEPTLVQFYFLKILNELYPDKNLFDLSTPNRLKMFDKVCGTDKIRKYFQRNSDFDNFLKFYKKDAENFRKESARFYLYD